MFNEDYDFELRAEDLELAAMRAEAEVAFRLEMAHAEADMAENEANFDPRDARCGADFGDPCYGTDEIPF